MLLELLIERGVLGWVVLAALAVGALMRAARGVAQQNALALVIGVSIFSALLVGAVISTIEIPRVSIMLWLLLVVSPLVRES
jgi:membrane protein implicated in regulation of membrane protease activity